MTPMSALRPPARRARAAAGVGCVGLLLLCWGGPAEGRGSPGPGRPLFPKPGRSDEQLYAKAATLQAGMWWHLSPEGLLVYRHRPGAGPDELSHAALSLSDAAMWTGCYLAAQAARWHVTADPDALAQCRVLAGGLARLGAATGRPGTLCRTVGRLAPGAPAPKRVRPSPAVEGLCFRGDVSRDQLAGVSLGWAALGRFVDDPDLLGLAREQVGALARRLARDDMELRDWRGKETEYGDLNPEIPFVPFVRNGTFAAIGYGVFTTAARLWDTPEFYDRLARLRRAGWRDALASQNAWLGAFLTASNANMAHVALLAVTLHGDPGSAREARRGLAELRRATVGWWNAGYCACQLLAGSTYDHAAVLGELRATLHAMPASEAPPRGARSENRRRIATALERGVVEWAWKTQADKVQVAPPDAPPDPDVTFTRADWLFAYWLARAAGYLAPVQGPGAVARTARIEPRLPPWRAAPAGAPAGR